MTIVCEIAFVPAPVPTAQAEFLADPARYWRSLPGLHALDLYTPAAGAAADPYVDDDAAPAQLLTLTFASPEMLEQAIRQAEFAAGLAALPGSALTCTAMQRIEYPVNGREAALPLAAPFSYLVRYHRPADDEGRFVQAYLDEHPAILGRLPGVRNVICDVPLAQQPASGLAPAEYMIGNEVAFDDIAVFNAAMASAVRHELRAHFQRLPAFTGRNTHYAMDRRRLLG